MAIRRKNIPNLILEYENEKTFCEQIGTKLRVARELSKVTQQEMADFIGIKRQLISGYELGNRNIPAFILYAYAKSLNLSIDNMFNGGNGFAYYTQFESWLQRLLVVAKKNPQYKTYLIDSMNFLSEFPKNQGIMISALPIKRMNEFDTELSVNLTSARKKADVSIKSLADMIGVSRQKIYRIEQNNIRINGYDFYVYVKLVNISVDDLFKMNFEEIKLFDAKRESIIQNNNKLGTGINRKEQHEKGMEYILQTLNRSSNINLFFDMTMAVLEKELEIIPKKSVVTKKV